MVTKLRSWDAKAIERILLNKLTARQHTMTKYLPEAIAYQLSVNLRYNMANGKIFNDSLGLVEEPADSSKYCPSCSSLDVLVWEFSRFIWNSASRLYRGYNP